MIFNHLVASALTALLGRLLRDPYLAEATLDALADHLERHAETRTGKAAALENRIAAFQARTDSLCVTLAQRAALSYDHADSLADVAARLRVSQVDVNKTGLTD